MPSTISSSVSRLFASSTVMTPSLPTFFIASARKRPISASPFDEMVPTWAISSFEVTFLELVLRCSTTASTARSTPRLRSIGFMPAATAFAPSRTIACASTVAVVVPSPATSEVLEATSRTICAPMFSSGSRSSISLATVTPSLVMIGAPNFFSITALRPLGPRVIFTASARAFTPRKIAWREFSPVTICFAISPFLLIIFELRNPQERARVGRPATTAYRPLPARTGSLGRAAQLRQDLLLAKDQVLFIFNLYFRTAVLAKENAVASLDVERDQLALLALAGANSDDFALHGLFFRRVRDDDATLHCFLLFYALHDDAVVERDQMYCHLGQPP